MTCPCCPKGFDKIYNYKRHILTIHPGSEWAKEVKKSKELPSSLLESYVRPAQGKRGPKPKVEDDGEDWSAYRNPAFDPAVNEADAMDPLARKGVPDNQCHVCAKIFSHGKKDVRRHIMQVHMAIKEFLCIKCGKGFHCKSHLKRHVEGVHEEAGGFKCEHCTKTYMEERHLNVHVRTVHMGAKDFMVSTLLKK